MIIVHNHTWSTDHKYQITSERPIINASYRNRLPEDKRAPSSPQDWAKLPTRLKEVSTAKALLLFCSKHIEISSSCLFNFATNILKMRRSACIALGRKGHTACLLRVVGARYCSFMCTGVYKECPAYLISRKCKVILPWLLFYMHMECTYLYGLKYPLQWLLRPRMTLGISRTLVLCVEDELILLIKGNI